MDEPKHPSEIADNEPPKVKPAALNLHPGALRPADGSKLGLFSTDGHKRRVTTTFDDMLVVRPRPSVAQKRYLNVTIHGTLFYNHLR